MKTSLAMGPSAGAERILDAAKAKKDAGTPEQVGKELEAHFLRQVFSEVRDSLGAVGGGGFAGDSFHQMLDEAMADSMAKSGSTGIASMITKQLESAAASTTSDDSSPRTTTPLKLSTARSIHKYGGGHAD